MGFPEISSEKRIFFFPDEKSDFSETSHKKKELLLKPGLAFGWALLSELRLPALNVKPSQPQFLLFRN